MSFGSLLRKLRYQQDIGIKKLASEIDVDYAYLSRIENDKIKPSERAIEKISKYFNYSKDELMILGDKIPEDIRSILKENPEEAMGYLREKFARGGRGR
jgi:transcriptional regulator with XRE-family HTH domain